MMRYLYISIRADGQFPRRADWKTEPEKFPVINEAAWYGEGDPKWQTIYQQTFSSQALEIINACHEADLIVGHNIYFIISTLKANILRFLGPDWYEANEVELALWKGKRIDTMRPAMQWVDAREQDGTPRFPSIAEVFARCFPGEPLPPATALGDIVAIASFLPELIRRGFITPKPREYDAKGKPVPITSPERAKKPSNSHSILETDKDIINEKKVEIRRFSDKITSFIQQNTTTMEVVPKFMPGERVWLMRSNKPVPAEVKRVSVSANFYVSSSGEQSTNCRLSYHLRVVDEPSEIEVTNEQQLYTSKEDLCKAVFDL